MVRAAPLGDEARSGRGADQPDRLARHAHPDLELRADRYPRDELAEDVHEERPALVLAVVADLLAEETGGHADAELRPGHPQIVRAARSSRTSA